MENRLDWTKLLCGDRCRESSTKKYTSQNINDEIYDHRNEFDKDYDRIVYSSSVRRLQDKAQVFPLQENDFTRTRLTHSLEASALGRSFGYAIGEWLLEEKKDFTNHKQVRELAALLQVSALIHDLGNPPFGHYGESIIRNWFKEWFETEEFRTINDKFKDKKITEEQMQDFIKFEGNAQTLRIVSKLQLMNDEYGANFTYGTLATIIKYPWSSMDEKAKSKEKFGFFYAEKNLIEKIEEATGVGGKLKHPVTFLLEASDDIAYLLADIEDGVKKGIIPWNSEYEKIKDNLLKKDEKTYKSMFLKLDEIKKQSIDKKIPNDDLIAVQNFKVLSQGLMFKQAVKSFKDNYEDIMTGKFDKDLLKSTKSNALKKELQELAKKYCFINQEVISLELVGDNVITGLLDRFVPSLTDIEKNLDLRSYEGKMYSLISDNFKYVCCFDQKNKKQIEFNETSMYYRLLLITDFISGMTDSYAVNLYKKLIGVRLP